MNKAERARVEHLSLFSQATNIKLGLLVTVTKKINFETSTPGRCRNRRCSRRIRCKEVSTKPLPCCPSFRCGTNQATANFSHSVVGRVKKLFGMKRGSLSCTNELLVWYKIYRLGSVQLTSFYQLV
jgi:hypothetical protein